MFQNRFALVIAALLAVSSTSAQICSVPVKEAFAPCRCEENTLRIYCGDDTDLKAVFERASAVVDDNLVFGEILITGQRMSELPANYMGNLKFKRIGFEFNRNLNWIRPGAFNSTAEHITHFHIGENAIMSYEENHELWTVLSTFRNLEDLAIHYNQIRYIPDDPFPEVMPNLKRIRIGNKLEHLGTGFFANLPALEYADFTSAGLTLDMLSPATFEGIGPAVQLYLQWNEFPQLPQELFGSVLNNAAGLYVGGESCYWGFCSHERLNCGEEINWICSDVDLYEPKLDGYFCTNTALGDHIWVYCDNLNKNKTIH